MNEPIGKAATNLGRLRHRCLFYASAREGFADLLAYTCETGAGVALPAFIGWSPREGSGVFDPVRAAPVAAAFYDLHDDLTVNLASLERMLASNDIRLLVVIHYFGRTQPRMDAIVELARCHNVILVEDLAHGFYSWAIGGSAGRWGDVGLFSLHKMLPRSDGGMMVYRDCTLLSGQQETAPELARFLLDYDWYAIAAARRATFLALLDRLRASPLQDRAFRLLWSDLAEGDVPQTLPVRIVAGDRDALYHAMNADGFGMTSLYHTLIEEVRDAFPAMQALSRSIINFPVHQDVDPHRIDAMVQSFESIVGAGSR